MKFILGQIWMSGCHFDKRINFLFIFGLLCYNGFYSKVIKTKKKHYKMLHILFIYNLKVSTNLFFEILFLMQNRRKKVSYLTLEANFTYN